MTDSAASERESTVDPTTAWLRIANDFWSAVTGMGPTSKGDSVRPEDFMPNGRLQEYFKSNLKLWEASTKAMSQPEGMEAILKGFQAAPEISMHFLQTSIEGFSEIQKRWGSRLEKFGQSTEPYSFSDLDSEFLTRWTDIYKKEFQRFFNIPQLGLTKFYQEKLNRMVDKYNVFNAASAEFMHVLFVPMEKSFRVMQEEVTGLAESGKLPEDTKSYYQMWIKILEGHYMTLFQSHEYTGTLARTLDAMNQFLASRTEVLEDILKLLPVSTHRETDELNQEIYRLKRRMRILEKKLQTQETQ
jgi:polyhydroxyalkanoate synthase subunit PhaE